MTDFNLTIHPQDFFMPLGFVEQVEIIGSGEAKTQVDMVPYGDQMVELEGGTDHDYTTEKVIVTYSPNGPDDEEEGVYITKEFNSDVLPAKLLGIIEAAIECELEENQ